MRPSWTRRRRQSTPAFLTLVLLAILTVATTGWLLSTAPRGDQPIFGQWDPQFANMAHWGGQIRSVQRSGEPIPSQRLPPTPPALESAPITGPITILSMGVGTSLASIVGTRTMFLVAGLMEIGAAGVCEAESDEAEKGDRPDGGPDEPSPQAAGKSWNAHRET